MVGGQPGSLLRHVRGLVLARENAGLSDAQLLESFLAQRDEAAFAVLVRRHGPMVLGVCRRVLRDAHDAEDAFQATFLVLVRKAASLRQRALLGNWLYGVACRTALEARSLAARRRAKERQVRDMPRREAVEEPVEQHWRPLLDLELRHLPDKYRAPIILCDLQGLSRRDAARHLDCSEGTLSGRLARARRMLAQRLTRRGVTLSAGALATLLGEQAAVAAVPAMLASSTVKAAALVAAGQTAAVGTKVVALTEGVIKTMLLSKLKIATTVLLTLGLVGSGTGLVWHQALAADPMPAGQEKAAGPAHDKPAEAPKQASDMGTLKQLDKTAKTITILSSGAMLTNFFAESVLHYTVRPAANAEFVAVAKLTEAKHNLAPNVQILIDGKEGTLEDLTPQTPLELTLEGGKVVRIQANGATELVFVRGVDLGTRTIMVGSRSPDDPLVDQTRHELALDAGVLVNGKKARIEDLAPGMRVRLQMSAVKPQVIDLRAEGPRVDVMIRAVDAARRTITVRLTELGMLVERLPVAEGATVRLGKEEVTLADLKPGSVVALRMDAHRDKSLVVGIEGNARKN